MIKRITKLFILLILVVIFIPQARADELLSFDLGNGTWTWTMERGALPDRGSFASGDFEYLQVPVFSKVSDLVQTFDLHFFTLDNPRSRNFQLACDPFFFSIERPQITCDYMEWIQIDGDSGFWNSDGLILGDHNGLVISTPEPETIALLLLGLAAVARRAKT